MSSLVLTCTHVLTKEEKLEDRERDREIEAEREREREEGNQARGTGKESHC